MIFAKDFGFLPQNDGMSNAQALQKAVNQKGDIYVDIPGTYELADTVYLDDDTNLIFGAGIWIKRVKNESETGNVFINKGAYERKYNQNIKLIGLKLICDGVVSDEEGPDKKKVIPGISAQVAFYYIKNLEIRDFQVYDLPAKDFAIQICTFENIMVENVRIEGLKDGIHLGRGSKFVIRHGIFKTFDDPIALNAHDYSTSNPQLGWIEEGIIEDCYDLDDDDTTGFFCRILAGSWKNWEKGMQVQRSDSVVYDGKIYRVIMPVDGKIYTSVTPPTHDYGMKEYDGIMWCQVQNDTILNCGCRNIHFKDIYLKKKRPVAFSIHFDKDNWSRSYYPNSPAPVQENLIFENINFQNEIPVLLSSRTPVTGVKVINSVIDNSSIVLEHIDTEGIEYPTSEYIFSGTTFRGNIDTLIQCGEGMKARVKILGSIAPDGFETSISGDVEIAQSDIKINCK